MGQLELSFNLNISKYGIDGDPLNPLSRAFRVSLEEGKPTPGYAFCFYCGEEKEFLTDPIIRWVGIFVYSSGNRIIFFPGFSETQNWVQTTTQGRTFPKQTFLIDHISLEPYRQRWHFTTCKYKSHKEGGRTPDLGGGRLNWFGLSAKSEEHLRIVLSITRALFPIPPNDVSRRIDLLKEAYSKAPHHSIGIDNGSREKFREGFPHFCFTAIPKGASNYQGPDWLIPAGSPGLRDPFPNTDIQIRVHKIDLPGDFDIQISCMWLPGAISTPYVWTTYEGIC